MAIELVTPYEEVLDFLLSAPSLAQVIALHSSESAQQRLRYLLEANRNGMLTAEERAELEISLNVEHLVRLLKIRARLKQGNQA